MSFCLKPKYTHPKKFLIDCNLKNPNIYHDLTENQRGTALALCFSE